MPEKKPFEWESQPGSWSHAKRVTQESERALRLRYWFPQVPLAAALALSGLLLLRIVFVAQRAALLADFPMHILDFQPRHMPFVLIGVAMLVMSVGLLFRSRFAWIIAILLAASTVLSAAIVGHEHRQGLIWYNGALLILLPLAHRKFTRSSLAASTLFSLTSVLLVLIYSVFGSLYFGNQFSPPIKDLTTAFYFAIVTMSTVGYGNPSGAEGRLFTASVIILGLAVFATSLTTIVAPMIAHLTTRKEKRMKHSGHFIVIGSTPLAYNTYREFKQRQQDVTLILPREAEWADIDPADVIIGDPNSLETLRKANAGQAQAVLAMRADDSDNAFIVLAVKELKGPAKTVVAINDSKHMERIKLVQPDMIIAPEVLGGELLAMMLSGEPITGDFVMQRFLHFDQKPSPPGS